ncbi:NAD(P)-dependent oxidoreductase (plasmid) [Bacillus cereus]|uniref:Glutamate synthase, small subunit n=1 Tax=Bacillus cereus (strain ZK / E33L) TaxID=288681 RepID=Q4V1I8_BACCZ|nr:NAD(P)-dependent oxidoreductase [Bacillus cereus]AAY60419.1 glutamate synthase, small subunit [Bacillus cereus E33L]AJI26398.1 FAD dependent oxidoreductase family protein [Bacillus cereus E33L]QQA19205.1 NAD(P)-dependent oxidoreductase [Bacillus cereus]
MNKTSKAYSAIEDIKHNFLEVKPDLTFKEVIEEANRCLYCYDAPCIKACPTSIDIPSFIKKITTDNLKGSARVILEANPVGATCARVCPTEELCEGACVLNEASQPIKIGDLQRHVTNWTMKNEVQLFKEGEKKGKTIAIVGGGPAGLSTARELARLGYAVTIFEAKEKAGGLDTYGIVSFRLPQEVSLWEVDQIKKLGVKILTNTKVGKDITVSELMNNFDVIVLAIGMASVPNLNIEGENLEGVYDAIQFVEDTKSKEPTSRFLGSRIAVIGAGNTAIDAATCSVRLGAENVKMIYRRTQEEMPAYQFEYEFAKQGGVEFKWLTQPKRIIGNENGHVKQLESIRMELGAEDSSGRRRFIPIEGSEFIFEVDAVIKAIGQTRYIKLIEEFGLLHNKGIVKINPKTKQTSNPKIFAAGDVVFDDDQGEAMVVSAAEQGKQTAYAIHKYVFGYKLDGVMKEVL